MHYGRGRLHLPCVAQAMEKYHLHKHTKHMTSERGAGWCVSVCLQVERQWVLQA